MDTCGQKGNPQKISVFNQSRYMWMEPDGVSLIGHKNCTKASRRVIHAMPGSNLSSRLSVNSTESTVNKFVYANFCHLIIDAQVNYVKLNKTLVSSMHIASLLWHDVAGNEPSGPARYSSGIPIFLIFFLVSYQSLILKLPKIALKRNSIYLKMANFIWHIQI